jgi:hypothetical protein
MRRRRVSGAVTSTEIADDGLLAACVEEGLEAFCTHMRAKIHTKKILIKFRHAFLRSPIHIRTRTHAGARAQTRTYTQVYSEMTPSAQTHTFFKPHLFLALPAHALAYTPTHTHAHATAHTPKAHVDGGLHGRMDARTKRRRGARGTLAPLRSPRCIYSSSTLSLGLSADCAHPSIILDADICL